jgi:hypothetical protein
MQRASELVPRKDYPKEAQQVLYQFYVAGRDALGLTFKRHRTHKAFTLANEHGVFAAWKAACADNANAGNPFLPSFLKAFLEVVGVLLLALFGLKRWRVVATAALLLLAQTASERDSASSHDWNNDPEWDEEGAQRVRGLLNQIQPGLGDDVDEGTRRRFLEMGDDE